MIITEEQRKLAEDNHNLIYSFLRKYDLSVEDYYDLAAIGLCKAAIKFNKDKGIFSTYAYKCMFTTVFAEIRKSKACRMIPEYQILHYQEETKNNDGDTTCFMNFIPSKENVEDSVILKVMLDEFVNELKDEKHKQIFELLKKGYTQRQIGKVVGCSQPQVSRIKKKLRKHLKNLSV